MSRFERRWMLAAAFVVLGAIPGSCRDTADHGEPIPTPSPPASQWTYTPTPPTPTPPPPCDETVALLPVRELVPWPAEWPTKACHEDVTTPPVDRLEPGALDTTFGDAGILHLDGRLILDLREQPDGKLVYVAWDEVNTGVLLCRIERDGTADPTFGSANGCTTSALGGFVLGLSGGKIYLAGTDFAGEGVFVTRFDDKGVVDSSFGTDGVTRILPPPGYGPATLRRMRIAHDRIYVSAILEIETPHYPVLFRLQFDGTMDSSFGAEGHVLFATQTGGLDQVVVLPVPDGRVLASSRNGVFLFGADGSIDPSFGSGRGCVNLHRVFNLLYGGSEGIAAIGWAFNTTWIEPTGELGEWLPHMPRIGPVPDAYISSSGVIVGGGSGGPDEDFQATIARRLPDGSPDESFGPSGARHFINNDSYGTTFEVQCDGRYVLGGHRDYLDGYILRVWN